MEEETKKVDEILEKIRKGLTPDVQEIFDGLIKTDSDDRLVILLIAGLKATLDLNQEEFVIVANCAHHLMKKNYLVMGLMITAISQAIDRKIGINHKETN